MKIIDIIDLSEIMTGPFTINTISNTALGLSEIMTGPFTINKISNTALGLSENDSQGLEGQRNVPCYLERGIWRGWNRGRHNDLEIHLATKQYKQKQVLLTVESNMLNFGELI